MTLAKMIGMERKPNNGKAYDLSESIAKAQAEGFNLAVDELDKWTVSKKELVKVLDRVLVADAVFSSEIADDILTALPTILTKERE